ncbi:hypothetical protein EB72_01160 [Mycobacterium sp. SWH-M1]|nr:hypothetical protein EB72_01160 [Mycobacterium sp. SWH-M1]
MDAHILASFRRTRRVHRSAWGMREPRPPRAPAPMVATPVVSDRGQRPGETSSTQGPYSAL